MRGQMRSDARLAIVLRVLEECASCSHLLTALPAKFLSGCKAHSKLSCCTQQAPPAVQPRNDDPSKYKKPPPLISAASGAMSGSLISACVQVRKYVFGVDLGDLRLPCLCSCSCTRRYFEQGDLLHSLFPRIVWLCACSPWMCFAPRCKVTQPKESASEMPFFSSASEVSVFSVVEF